MDEGLTVNEINEVLAQLYAYCGFPRSLNAITAFKKLLQERKSKGITDKMGKEASPLPADKSSEQIGNEVLTKLIGRPLPDTAYIPVIRGFLTKHLFGDIFGRDVLSYKMREIATISALASIKGINPQLRAHLQIGLKVGLTVEQVKSIIAVLGSNVNEKIGKNAMNVFEGILKKKK